MCLNYTCIIFFFQFAHSRFPRAVLLFSHRPQFSARNYRTFVKIDILFYEHHVRDIYKHIFLNFGKISFINKEMVTFFSTAHL